MVLFLVGNCYGYDKQLEGEWKSRDKNLECELTIYPFQECLSEICLSFKCDNKPGNKFFSFPGYDLINTQNNLSLFGDKNVIFWEINRNGKSLTIFPKNIDKMESHKYGFGNSDFYDTQTNDKSLFRKIIQQIPKMKFVKE